MNQAVVDKYLSDLKPRPFSLTGKIWVYSLLAVCFVGLFSYIKQLRNGLSVTDMNDYVVWGIYISNFVFFVAVSLVGSLISAILKLSGVHWATPLTRIAEIIAVGCILFASIVIVVDMGRPERLLNLIFHGRIQSPIIWDVLVISTYLLISIILLYLPLIPDIALLRDNASKFPVWQQKLYRKLSLGWQGLPEQRRLLKMAIRLMAILIIPVAFGIHTVTSWLFASTLRPGWNSTDFGPYFVSGAFLVGAASVVIAMYLLRRYYSLHQYITDMHFDKMGKIVVMLSLLYAYFNLNEYFIPAYKMIGSEAEHLKELIYGRHALFFWSVQVFGMLLPAIILLFKKGRQPKIIFSVAILIIVGAWFKRWLIVVPTLTHPYIPTHRVPGDWLVYFPTFDEWAITAATLAGALLVMTFLVRLYPPIPIIETIEEDEELLEEAQELLSHTKQAR